MKTCTVSEKWEPGIWCLNVSLFESRHNSELVGLHIEIDGLLHRVVSSLGWTGRRAGRTTMGSGRTTCATVKATSTAKAGRGAIGFGNTSPPSSVVSALDHLNSFDVSSDLSHQ